MLRCKDVTELIGTDGVAAAPFRTRMGVRMHLAWCRHCRAYARSLRQIAEVARRAALLPAARMPALPAAPDATASRERRVIDAVRREAEALRRPPATSD